jgi:hypothetical protein
MGAAGGAAVGAMVGEARRSARSWAGQQGPPLGPSGTTSTRLFGSRHPSRAPPSIPIDTLMSDTHDPAVLKAITAYDAEERRRVTHMATSLRMPKHDAPKHPCSNPHDAAQQ